jgi:hypothetical protein
MAQALVIAASGATLFGVLSLIDQLTKNIKVPAHSISPLSSGNPNEEIVTVMAEATAMASMSPVVEADVAVVVAETGEAVSGAIESSAAYLAKLGEAALHIISHH